MTKLRIKLIKSKIGSTQRQKNTIQALGLNKIDSYVEVDGTKPILGMIAKVNHLVSVEEI